MTGITTMSDQGGSVEDHIKIIKKQYEACAEAFKLILDGGVTEDVLVNSMLNYLAEALVSHGTTTHNFNDVSHKLIQALGQYFLDNLHTRYEDMQSNFMEGINSLDDVPEIDEFTRALFENYEL
jgi:hypothetical protein